MVYLVYEVSNCDVIMLNPVEIDPGGRENQNAKNLVQKQDRKHWGISKDNDLPLQKSVYRGTDHDNVTLRDHIHRAVWSGPSIDQPSLRIRAQYFAKEKSWTKTPKNNTDFRCSH